MNADHNSSVLSTMSKAKAAQLWYQLGYKVIPLVGGTKITPLRHGPWLEALSAQAIDVCWSTNPTYDIALHCSTGLIVLDADTPESIAALEALEVQHGVVSNLIVQTKKGVHHYYKRPAGLLVKVAGHSTENHPERIDIRCDNGYIVAAPSTDKVVLSETLVPHDRLTEITQVFIDDLLIHNGGTPLVETPVKTTFLANPKDAGDADECGEPLSMTLKIARLRAMLKHIDPEGGYQEVWIPTLMAIKHATNGSDEGLCPRRRHEALCEHGARARVRSPRKGLHLRVAPARSGCRLLRRRDHCDSRRPVQRESADRFDRRRAVPLSSYAASLSGYP